MHPRFAYTIALVVLAVGAGCFRSVEIDEADLADAVDLASGVNAVRQQNFVYALAEAHGSDMARAGAKRLTRQAAGELIVQRLSALGLNPQRRRYCEEWCTWNITVEFSGSLDPSRIILVSAHYDAWFVGANDNGSGVSALLELARLWRTFEGRHTLRVLFTDQEEMGLLGMSEYLRHHVDRLDEDIVLNINLDMIGYASSEPNSQRAPPGLVVPDVADFVVAIGNDDARWLVEIAHALPERADLGARVAGVLGPTDLQEPLLYPLGLSDHREAWKRGMPALFLTDTAYYRYDHYHRSTDTPDRLDYDFLASNTRLLVALTAIADRMLGAKNPP